MLSSTSLGLKVFTVYNLQCELFTFVDIFYTLFSVKSMEVEEKFVF